MTLSTSDIARALKSDQNAAWTWEGAKALAEYLEEYEESTGEEMELDVCALRCDFSEHGSLEAWAKEQWGDDLAREYWREESGENEEQEEKTREYIQDRGTLLEFDGGVIVSSF